MAKSYYLPKGDEDRAIWLNNIAAKLPNYASKYGIMPEETMGTQNDAAYFDAFIKYYNQQSAFQKSLTDHKNAVRDGVENGGTLQPLAPPMMMLPLPVVPGIFKRVKALVNRIKAHIHYSEADGYDLGIEGAEKTVDPASIKPSINLRIGDGGHPDVLWVKYGYDGVEIHKQVDDGELKFLAIDMQPHYTDMSELPPPGKSAVWKYRAIYLRKDKRVGQWSDVVTITVTG